ncbi:MAG: hypothetical protein K6U89_14090 [Chloroflexi bacterium]|nr:hypothetical protein [Chloroflexota bacterium]
MTGLREIERKMRAEAPPEGSRVRVDWHPVEEAKGYAWLAVEGRVERLGSHGMLVRTERGWAAWLSWVEVWLGEAELTEEEAAVLRAA